MSYTVLFGIPKNSPTDEYEYVYGDHLKSQVANEKRHLSVEYRELELVELDSNDFGAISDKLEQLNNGDTLSPQAE